jgi:RHS repeat-associated protein
MEPNITITYNSEARNGIMGWGWELNAISAISRGHKTLKHDGANAAIGTGEEAFYYDGQRLFKSTNTIVGPLQRTLYLPEIFAQLQIEAISDVTNGNILYWEIKSNNGNIITFGSNTNAQVSGENGSPQIMVWRIEKLLDPNGNYLTYKYINTDRDFRIDEIAYTGNQAQGLLPYNKVKFEYATRKDQNTTYKAGASFNLNNLLTGINVTTEGGAAYRTYTFKYAYNNQYSYLVDIGLKGSDGTEINSTKFKYFDKSADVTETVTNVCGQHGPIKGQEQFTQTGDFNGDGLSDLLVATPDIDLDDPACVINTVKYTKDPTNNNDFINPTAVVNNNFAPFMVRAPLLGPITIPLFNYTFSIPNGFGNRTISQQYSYLNCVDWDGDEKDDIGSLEVSNPDFDANCLLLGAQVAVINGYIVNGVQKLGTPDPSFSYCTACDDGDAGFNLVNVNLGTLSTIGDFDGDGKQDYFIIANTHIITKSGTFNAKNQGKFDKAFVYLSTLSYVPKMVNGMESSLKIGHGSCSKTENVIIEEGKEAYNIQAVDFDGDGRLELMISRSFDANKMFFNIDIYKIEFDNTAQKCNAQLVYNLHNPFVSTIDIKVGDFNGDAIADLCFLEDDSPNNILSASYKILFGTGQIMTKGKSYVEQTGYLFTRNLQITRATSKRGELIVSDLDGDGKTDILFDLLVPTTSINNFVVSRSFDIYYSNGNKFNLTNVPAVSNNYFNTTVIPIQNPLIFGDFNGDGVNDIMYMQASTGCGLPTTHPYAYSSFKPFNKERKIEKIVNGTGYEIKYEFDGYITGGNGFYEKGTGAAYPLNNIVPRGLGLKSITVPNGIGGTSITTFKYFNALMHREGKGYLGFEKVTSANQDANTETQIFTSILPIHYLPYNSKIIIKNISTNTDISITEKYISAVQLGHQMFSKTDLVKEQNLLTNTFITTSNEYDYNGAITHGNITKTIQNINNIVNSETAFDYIDNNSIQNYLTGIGNFNNKNLQTTFTKTRVNHPTITTLVEYVYANGKLQSTSKNNNIVTYGYDVFGNTTAINTTAPAIGTKSLTTVFDTKGRFVIEDNNVLGQTTTTVNDAIAGKAKSITGPTGLTTAYTYNGFGNVLTVKDVNKNITTTNYTQWAINNNVLYTSYTLKPASATVVNFHDALGRVIEIQKVGFNNNIIYQNTTYNAKGQVTQSTLPYLSTETPEITTNTYDAYGRIKTSAGLGRSVTHNYSIVYNMFKHEILPSNGQNTFTITDATGAVIHAQDNGGDIFYDYDSWGNVLETRMDQPANTYVITQNKYDIYGRKIEMHDKASGTIIYEYDDFDRLIKQTDANGNITDVKFDIADRMTTRTITDGSGNNQPVTTTYKYEPTNNGLNQIAEITHHDGTNVNQENYVYDSYGRTVEHEKILNGKSYKKNYAYDIYDRLTNTIYPSGLNIEKRYDNSGYLKYIFNSNSIAPLYTVNDVNGMGQITEYICGNYKTTSITYNKGLPTSFITPNVFEYNLQYNYASQNVLKRTQKIDNLNTNFETFTYDNKDRLLTSQVNNVHIGTASTFTSTINPITMQYDGNPGTNARSYGNINAKSDIGVMAYNRTPAMAHGSIASAGIALPTYTMPGAPPMLINTGTQDIKYTAFQKVDAIDEDVMVGTATVHQRETFVYDAGFSRIKSEYDDGLGNIRTRIYLDDYEEQTDNTTNNTIHYISSPTGLCAIVTVLNTNHGIDFKTHYTYTDHLGSINVVTNATGTIEHKQSFDAWGRPRNAADWSFTNITAPPIWLYRGFTGHEMMPEFALINMNARLYDYIVGGMLSPDNLTHPGTQGLNRYSYAFNNPLKYIDPSGNQSIPEFFGFHNGLQLARVAIPTIIIGAVSGGIANAIVGAAYVAAGGFYAGAVIGAISGGIGGFLTSVTTDVLNGNPVNWEHAFTGALFGALSGALIGGFTAGFKAQWDGQDFWNGRTERLSAKVARAVGEDVTGGSKISLNEAKEINKKATEILMETMKKNRPNLNTEGSAISIVRPMDMSDGSTELGELLFNGKTTNLNAAIANSARKGISAHINISVKALTSKEQFMEVLLHEIDHLEDFASGNFYNRYITNLGFLNNKSVDAANLAVYQSEVTAYNVSITYYNCNSFSVNPEFINYKLSEVIQLQNNYLELIYSIKIK